MLQIKILRSYNSCTNDEWDIIIELIYDIFSELQVNTFRKIQKETDAYMDKLLSDIQMAHFLVVCYYICLCTVGVVP